MDKIDARHIVVLLILLAVGWYVYKNWMAKKKASGSSPTPSTVV